MGFMKKIATFALSPLGAVASGKANPVSLLSPAAGLLGGKKKKNLEQMYTNNGQTKIDPMLAPRNNRSLY